MRKYVVDIAGMAGLSMVSAGVSLEWGYTYGLMVGGSLLLAGALMAARAE